VEILSLINNGERNSVNPSIAGGYLMHTKNATEKCKPIIQHFYQSLICGGRHN